MPTVIDSLVVTLGLDGSAYTKAIDTAVKGREKVAKADTAGGRATVDAEKKRKDAIQATTKVATEGYRAMAGQLLGILGVLGTIGAGGLLGRLASTNVQLDTNAKLLGMSTQQLYAWKKAADALGGSGDELQQSLAGINAELNDLSTGKGLGSKLTAVNALMSAARMPALDFRGMTAAQVLDKVREADSRVSPRVAQARNAEINISGANTLALRNSRWSSEVAKFQNDAPSDNAIEQSRQVKEMITQIDAAFESLENTVLADLGPAITKALGAATDWWAKNGQQFTTELESFLKSAATDANIFATAVGGWQKVGEGILAYYALTWMPGMRSAIGGIIKLLALIPGANPAILLAAGGLIAEDNRFNVANQLTNGQPDRQKASGMASILTGEYIPPSMGAGGVADDKIADWWNMMWGGHSVGDISKTMTPEGRGLLDAIAGGESTGYNVLNGGGTFSDYSQFPAGGKAAGRYQFMPDTWADEAKRLGLKDFSPRSQDAAAWDLAQRVYTRRTGRLLADDLKDPSKQGAIAGVLSGTWTSLPGGSQPNSNTGTFGGRLSSSIALERSNWAPPVPSADPRYRIPSTGAAAAMSGTNVTIHNSNTIIAPSSDAKSISQTLTNQTRRDIAVAGQYGGGY